MEITIGKILSWVFGILLILGGLGSMVQSITAGLILLLVGVFLLPPTRSQLKEKRNIEFSRWIVVLITFIGMVAAGMMLPTDTGTGSSGDSFGTSSPKEVTNQYWTYMTGFSTDFDAAYKLLAENATNQSQSDWVVAKNNLKASLDDIQRNKQSVEVVRTGDTRATVNITFRKKDTIDGFIIGTEEQKVILVRDYTNSEWRILDPPDIWT